MRKLATIRHIKSVVPAVNMDNLVYAVIDNWRVLVKKGDFKAGDLCVFFEIDSVLPERPWSEFMRKYNFTVKTIKMRGNISQGLVLPLQILDEHIVPVENLDVTDILGVEKCAEYEEDTLKRKSDVLYKEIPKYWWKKNFLKNIKNIYYNYGTKCFLKKSAKELKKCFHPDSDYPKGSCVSDYERFCEDYNKDVTNSHLDYIAFFLQTNKSFFPFAITDEERVQNFTDAELTTIRKTPHLISTEKIDGTSSGFAYLYGGYFIMGRKHTVCIAHSDPIVDSVVQKYKNTSSLHNGIIKYYIEQRKIERIIALHVARSHITSSLASRYFAVYGECFGAGIQNNRLNRDTIELAYFYADSLLPGGVATRMGFGDFVKLCKNLDLQRVPIINSAYKAKDAIDMIPDAIGNSKISPNCMREGIVVHDLRFEKSFKVINPEYCLKYGL